jgi:hypothetical protein
MFNNQSLNRNFVSYGIIVMQKSVLVVLLPPQDNDGIMTSKSTLLCFLIRSS